MHGYFPVKPFSVGAMALAGAVFLVPSTAAAEGINLVTVGVTISYSIGARPAFGIGGDLRFARYPQVSGPYDTPYSNPPGNQILGIGAFLQGTYLVGGAGRFAFGPYGSLLTKGLLHLDTEIGATIRTDSMKGNAPGGVGIHLGLAPLVYAFLVETGPTFRGSIALSKGMRSEFIIGGDIRGPPPAHLSAASAST